VDHQPLASAWQRLGAGLLDGFILVLPVMLASHVLLRVLHEQTGHAELALLANSAIAGLVWSSSLPLAVWRFAGIALTSAVPLPPGLGPVGLLPLAVVLAINAYLVARRGQSIAKFLLKIRVVRAEDGARAGFARIVLVRTLIPSVIGNALPIMLLLAQLRLPAEMVFSTRASVLLLLVDAALVLTKSRRSLRDLLARTDVVDLRTSGRGTTPACTAWTRLHIRSSARASR
jgi:uncharacterized RDD family membrane protein YckC